ncbi:hypothetical protein DFH06DRAFT_1133485 [Mycena polygramma]|nr:hypothetical protein DFH06DRAFT_1133485 [Mycena polygramma]
MNLKVLPLFQIMTRSSAHGLVRRLTVERMDPILLIVGLLLSIIANKRTRCEVLLFSTLYFILADAGPTRFIAPLNPYDTPPKSRLNLPPGPLSIGSEPNSGKTKGWSGGERW